MSNKDARVSIRVVIAAADDLVLASLSKGLGEAGFTTIEASDGETALAACLNNPPNLAILDYDMPIVTGIEIAERVRESNRLPIVILSGHHNESMENRASDAGAMAYLLKPVDATRLIPTVRTALRRFAEMETLRAEALKLTSTLERTKSTSVAVGILMEKLQLTERDAYDRLRSFARSQSSKVSDIALDVSTRVGELNSVVNRIAAMKSRGGSEPAGGAGSVPKMQLANARTRFPPLEYPRHEGLVDDRDAEA